MARESIPLAEIVGEPLIALAVDEIVEASDLFWRAAGLIPKRVLRTASVEAVRSLVANGLGYTVLNHPSKTLTTYDGKETRAVKLSDALPPAPIAAVHLADHKLRPVAQAFLDFTRNVFRRERRTA